MEQNNIYKLVFKVTHAGGSGSCFYLKDYDLFVTNYHVVKGFHAVAVHDNDRNPYLAKVVLVNPSLDIALLSVDGDFSALPSLNLAGDNSLSIGGKVCGRLSLRYAFYGDRRLCVFAQTTGGWKVLYTD